MSSQQSCRRTLFSSSSFLPFSLLVALTLFSSHSSAAPFPVGGFAICQTASALHIQGGVTYEPSATYLQPTNQHFRLDLSQSFGSASSPVWANLTSDFSPYQRYHSGACAPGGKSFLTVGNADIANTDAPGFMMAYSMDKGTWNAVEGAVSQDTSPSNENNGKGNNKNAPRVSAAGRAMAGFTLAVNPATGSPVPSSADVALGVVIGGGRIAQKARNTPSVLATDMVGLVTEADLISIGKNGDLDEKSFTWKVVPNNGNDGNSLGNVLGPIVGTRVVIAPGGTKAVVLGGVRRGGNGNAGVGVPLGTLVIVDMATGAVSTQKTQSVNANGTPAPRYGHCVALSTDGNTAYIFGGALVANDRVTNELFSLNLQTWTWSQPNIQAGTVNPPPVRDHQCIMVGDQLLSLFGFNSNGAPASASPLALTTNGTESPIPPAPPIYVFSTSQWSWSTQFTALPGTPRPPTPPSVSTDGSKGKVNGVAVGFGVVFGLAFAGVIGYQVYSHRRRKREKAETLLLIEMEQRRKEDEKLEQDRRKKDENSPLPAPPTQPYPAYLNNGTTGNYEQNYYSQTSENINNGYYQGGGMGHGYGQDPFQNPDYQHYQQQQQNTAQHSQQNQFTPNYYYANAGSPGTGGHDRNPFDQPLSSGGIGAVYPPPPQITTSVGGSSSQQYIPEEMGHSSPSQSGYHAGHGGGNYKVSIGNEGGLGARNAGDKMSFVDSSSAFR